ncbi:hypothetical protein HY416_02635 [Candidatus Kaiserbacteria bacterium]|nr:hypothetical protein [Candidatus Kaiserbacteria bacterium]
MAVEFEEQQFSQNQTRQGYGAVTQLVMKLGLAKNTAQANLVMLVIAIIAIGLTVYLILPSRATAPVPPTTMMPAEPTQ